MIHHGPDGIGARTTPAVLVGRAWLQVDQPGGTVANPGQRMLSTLTEIVVASSTGDADPPEEVISAGDLQILSRLISEPFEIGQALEGLMLDAHQD